MQQPKKYFPTCFAFLLILFPLAPLKGQVISTFQLGGQQGTTFEIELRTRDLDGLYGTWIDCDDLKIEVGKVERLETGGEKELNPKVAKQLNQRVTLTVQVKPSARTGYHLIRLLTRKGMSDAVWLRINSEPAVTESKAAHNTPRNAQVLKAPEVVSAKIETEGEVDYYSFDAQPGQQLLFELDSVNASAGGFDPILALVESVSDWFDDAVPKQLSLGKGFQDPPRKVTRRRLSYKFAQEGRYLLAIRDSLGRGKSDYSYQLRIVPISESVPMKERPSLETAAHTSEAPWLERTFARNISKEWLNEVLSRTVVVAKKEGNRSVSFGEKDTKVAANSENEADGLASLSVDLASVQEKEPNENPSDGQELATPCMIEGAIGHPGDVDYFKFKAKPGARIAFEIQTVETQPPLLNPEIEVLDGNQQEVLTNIYKFEVQDAWARSLQPKTTYTFERGGEYYLQIRDLSTRHGSPNSKYRVLIRPQVPHVGEIAVKEDCINLSPGEAKKLTVTAAEEEGFGGQIAVAVEGLPRGVQVFPAAEAEPAQGGSPRERIHPERFIPKTQTITIVLRASEDAPAILMPRMIKVKAWPIIEGKSGVPISVSEIPLLVVQRTN